MYYMADLQLKDVECPICFGILYEPVTLPCQHDFCLKCFKGNIQDASLACPICRRRLGNWLRKKKTPAAYINVEKWEKIKATFPDKIQSIIDGTDEPLNTYSPQKVIIAPPGAIKEEFKKQLEILDKEDREKEEKERKASLELIKRLCDSENSVSNISGNNSLSGDDILDVNESTTSTSGDNGHYSGVDSSHVVKNDAKKLSQNKSRKRPRNTISASVQNMKKRQKKSGPTTSLSESGYKPDDSSHFEIDEIRNVLGINDGEVVDLIKEQKRLESMFAQEKDDFNLASKLQSQLNSPLQTRRNTIDNYYRKKS